MASIPRHSRCREGWWVAVIVLLGGYAGPAWAQRPPADRLLPDTTVALLSVADAPEMIRQLTATAGQTGQNPQVAAAVSQLDGLLGLVAWQIQSQTGLSLEELAALRPRELAVAMVAPRMAPPATVLLLDLGEQTAQVGKLLEGLDAQMAASGATRQQKTVEGAELVIHTGVGPAAGTVARFLKDGTLAFSSDPEVLAELLVAFSGGRGRRIADSPGFATLMARCRGAGGKQPQLTWYVDPIAAMRGWGQEDINLLLAVAMLQTVGFDGVKAVGGGLSLDAEQCDWVMRARLSLDSPRYGLTGMIALQPGDAKPQGWVPADAASYTTFNWDMKQSYAELAFLYDSLYGRGSLARLVEWLLLDPLEINLEKQLLPALEGRITHVTWIERPATLQSQAHLWALKLKNVKLFAKALETLPSLPGVDIARRSVAGKTYYELQLPRSEDLPADRRLLQPCFGLLEDYLLLADRDSLYEKAVNTQAEGSASLADDPEYELVAEEIRRRSGEDGPALVSFNRPAETARWLSELAIARQGGEDVGPPAAGGGLLGGLLGGLATAIGQGPPPLPSAPGGQASLRGAMVVDDPTGLQLTAFSLQQKAD